MGLYSMKKYAQKTHLLAVKWGIGTVKMELWRKHANFVQLILDIVAIKSHSWAFQARQQGESLGRLLGLTIPCPCLNLSIWVAPG